MRPALRVRAMRIAALGAAFALTSAASAASVFNETFTRSASSTIGNNWVETNPSSNSGDVSILSTGGGLVSVFSNNSSDNGRSYITQAMSNFNAPIDVILGNNPGTVTWTLNMRSSISDLSGLDNSESAIAFVLAASGSDLTSASGYAVMWGGSTSTDPIRLVRFANGIDADANVTSMITASGASGTGGDPNTNYMSIKVTYNPFSDTFELFTRSDGTSSFSDPTTGSYTSAGTLVNTTFTSTTMSHIAAMGRYSGDNNDFYFDNINIDVVPEPASAAMIGLGVIALTGARRRRA